MQIKWRAYEDPPSRGNKDKHPWQQTGIGSLAFNVRFTVIYTFWLNILTTYEIILALILLQFKA